MFTWLKRMGVVGAVSLVAFGPATTPSFGQMARRSMMSAATMHRPFRPFRVIPHHPNRVFHTHIGTHRANMLRRDLRLDRLAALSGLSGLNGMNSMNPYLAGTGQPYGGDNGGGFDGGAGVLNGSANIIDSQGRLMISNEQATLLQEDVKRQRLRNQRAMFDEWLYERGNTVTLEQLRQDGRQLELTRARNTPPLTETLSGRSLNRLLDHLVKLQGQTGPAPSVPIDAEVLQQVHVTLSGDGIGLSLLREGGKLNWPTALHNLPPEQETGAVRDEVNVLLKEAVSWAERGRKDPLLLKQLGRDVDQLETMLKKQVRALPLTDYLEAKRYLSDLGDMLKVFHRPDVANYFNGRARVKGRTVHEVVEYMATHGLHFAPAGPGDEPAYVALQRAFTAYSDQVAPSLVSERER
jgi:hypothetical protein